MSEEIAAQQADGPGDDRVDWRSFLLETPPGTKARIRGLVNPLQGPENKLYAPEMELHCNSPSCGTSRFCSGEAPMNLMYGHEPHIWKDIFLRYRCRECGEEVKLYAIRVRTGTEPRPDGEALKVGEWPSFGPPTPPSLKSLIGPDRDLFLKGRHSEVHGLGIGAFSYYRRVVGNQKN